MVAVQSNQYFVPLLALNPVFKARLLELEAAAGGEGLGDGGIGSSVLRFLVRPSDAVLLRIQEIVAGNSHGESNKAQGTDGEALAAGDRAAGSGVGEGGLTGLRVGESGAGEEEAGEEAGEELQTGPGRQRGDVDRGEQSRFSVGLQIRLRCNDIAQCQSRGLYAEYLVERFAVCAFRHDLPVSGADVYVSSIANRAEAEVLRHFSPTSARVRSQTEQGTTQTFDLSSWERALADMFVLSFCDVILITQSSTFGYVAQSLGAAHAAAFGSWVIPAELSRDAAKCPEGPFQAQCRETYTAGCTQVDSYEPCFQILSPRASGSSMWWLDAISATCNQSLLDLPSLFYRQVC